MSLEQARANLLSAGADEVTCLVDGEVLRPHRLLEIVQRADHMSSKLREERAEVEARDWQKVSKFARALLGEKMKNEEVDEKGNLVRIGDYVLDRRIGVGAFGSVFRCQHESHGECAVKVLCKKRAFENPSEALSLETEFSVLLHLSRQSNVVCAHQVIQGEQFIAVVMGYAGPRNLKGFVQASLELSGATTLDASQIRNFCGQQTAAIQHLHSYLVCHRDLKPDNWIVSKSGETLQLSDFGFAVHLYSQRQRVRRVCGTLPFTAPEVWAAADKSYSPFAADAWSLGAGFLDLLLGFKGVEKLLGWYAKKPASSDVLTGLQTLPALAKDALANAALQDIASVTLTMLVLEPEQRWRVGQVMQRRSKSMSGPSSPGSTLCGAVSGKRATYPSLTAP